MLLSALFLVACSSDVSVTKHDIDHDNDGFDVEVDCDDAQRKGTMNALPEGTPRHRTAARGAAASPSG